MTIEPDERDEAARESARVWRGGALKECEPTDPMELIGAGFPCPSGEEADREMVEVFVEEYIRLGKSDDEIWRLFRNPTYRGTHRVLAERGEAFVREIVDCLRAQFGYWR